MKSTKARRGIGVPFLIAMLVLVVLAILGMAMKYSTRGATRLGEGVVAGEKALCLARGALNEAYGVLDKQLNEPDSQLKEALGVPFTSFGEAVEVSIEPVFTKGMAEKGTDVEDVSFAFYCSQSLLPANALEKYGVLRARAVVSVFVPALKRHVRKGIVQYREFKVIYPGPPRPFQRQTLFVLYPVHLAAYEKQYRQIQKQVNDTLQKKSEGKAPLPFANNSDVYQYYSKYNYPPFPYNERALPGDCVTDYPDGPIDLAKTDLDNPIYSQAKSLQGNDFKLRWPADLEANDSERDAFEEVQRRYEEGIKEALQKYVELFPFIPEGQMEELGAKYLSALMSIDMDGKVTVDEAAGLYRWCRCTHAFDNQEELWRALTRKDGVVNLRGIYYVDGPIDIDMQYRGAGTIVSADRITVRRCLKADGKSSSAICTLLTFSKPRTSSSGWCSLELEGSVQAGLVAVTGLVKNLHLYDVFGSLAVGQLSKEVIDGRGDGTSYNWTLSYDPALAYTDERGEQVRTQRCLVIISPCLAGARVVRGRG